MAKIRMEFKMKDLYAFKHSLQKTVLEKLKRVKELSQEEHDVVEMERLLSDIKHEEDLIKRLVKTITEIRMGI